MNRSIVSFEVWKKRNPRLHNWLSCIICRETGWLDEEDDVCFMCDGAGKIDDLYSLYLHDVEHDIFMLEVFVEGYVIPPGVKAAFESMMEFLR